MEIFYICSFVIREMLTSYAEQVIIFMIIVSMYKNYGSFTFSESNRKIVHREAGGDREIVTERVRKKCCPYNFNSKLCRDVGDRVLCGYDKNVGRPEETNNHVDLNNGCRIKNGRLECGYFQPPYTYNPRPPIGTDTSSDIHNSTYSTTSEKEKVLGATSESETTTVSYDINCP